MMAGFEVKVSTDAVTNIADSVRESFLRACAIRLNDTTQVLVPVEKRFRQDYNGTADTL
jgi:hypothetical protein